jgi:hypothetical protein
MTACYNEGVVEPFLFRRNAMYFKILKSSMDGISGGESRYETVNEVLGEISYFKGWDSRRQLHAAIRKWAEEARPGQIFCTQASAIIAFPVESGCREDDICHHCDHEGLDYGDIDGVEGGNLEQKVTCPECGKTWIDVFTLADQRELCALKGGA